MRYIACLKEVIKIVTGLFVLLTLNSCQIEGHTGETINYSESILDKSNYVVGYKVDSILAVDDTMKYYLTNHKKSYFSEIEFDQLTEYLFQDQSSVKMSTHNFFNFFYRAPLRDSLGYQLYIDEPIAVFIQRIQKYNNPVYKKKINELYLLDSSYGDRVEIVEILNLEIAIAESEFKNTSVEIFGINSLDFIFNYMEKCGDSKSHTYRKIARKALHNIDSRDNYGVSVKDDIRKFMNEICIKHEE